MAHTLSTACCAVLQPAASWPERSKNASLPVTLLHMANSIKAKNWKEMHSQPVAQEIDARSRLMLVPAAAAPCLRAACRTRNDAHVMSIEQSPRPPRPMPLLPHLTGTPQPPSTQLCAGPAAARSSELPARAGCNPGSHPSAAGPCRHRRSLEDAGVPVLLHSRGLSHAQQPAFVAWRATSNKTGRAAQPHRRPGRSQQAQQHLGTAVARWAAPQQRHGGRGACQHHKFLPGKTEDWTDRKSCRSGSGGGVSPRELRGAPTAGCGRCSPRTPWRAAGGEGEGGGGRGEGQGLVCVCECARGGRQVVGGEGE